MRTITFRGKRQRDGQWVYGSLMQHSNGTCEIISEQGILFSEASVEPNTIGQNTGLTDSTLKSIYEGDIVQYSDMLTTYNLRIVWDNTYGQWIAIDDCDSGFVFPLGQVASSSVINSSFASTEKC